MWIALLVHSHQKNRNRPSFTVVCCEYWYIFYEQHNINVIWKFRPEIIYSHLQWILHILLSLVHFEDTQKCTLQQPLYKEVDWRENNSCFNRRNNRCFRLHVFFSHCLSVGLSLSILIGANKQKITSTFTNIWWIFQERCFLCVFCCCCCVLLMHEFGNRIAAILWLGLIWHVHNG